MSRSSSVASNASHSSEPSWFRSYNGQDTSRKDSSATIASQKSTDSHKSNGGFGSWFKEDPKVRKEMKAHKAAEKKRRNDELKKTVDKIVITSKHAAAVKTKLATDQKLRRDSGDIGHLVGVTGTQTSAHMTAAQQEMRFPHSGPPALHGGHKGKLGKHEADMPSLTKIVSGDDRDEEEEMLRRREEWLSKKRPDTRMRHLSEGETPDDEEEELVEVMGNTVLHVQETPVIGMELEGEQYTPKPYKERHGRAGYQKGENGVWTKPRDGPHVLHNV